MSNIKDTKDFYDVATGKYSSCDASHIWSKRDNVKALYDSRGQYLGLMKQNERIVVGKTGKKIVTCKGGKYVFKPFYELEKWRSAKEFRFKDSVMDGEERGQQGD